VTSERQGQDPGASPEVQAELRRRGLSTHVSGFINLLADFLSTWQGFALTFLVLIIGIALGALVQFNDGFMFGFNIFLSIAAIVIAGVILVAGARSEAALHVKLDYLIECSKATNKVIGIEHKDRREIEEERKRVENQAMERVDDVIDEQLRDRPLR
jgi:low affinity Fe/Cu permease